MSPIKTIASDPIQNRSTQDLELQTYREKALKVILLCAALACLVGMGLFFKNPVLRAETFGCACLAFLGFILAKKSHVIPASAILGLLTLGTPLIFAESAMGIYDPTIMIIPVGMIIMSLVVPNPRVVWGYCALSLLVMAHVTWKTVLGQIGNPVTNVPQETILLDGLVGIAIMSCCVVASGLIGGLLDRLLKSMQAHHHHLEQEVASRTAQIQANNEDLTQALEKLSKATEEMVRNEKLAGLGRLVAGVAHELNTPIGNVNLAMSTLVGKAEEFKYLMANKGISRSALEKLLKEQTDAANLALSANAKAADLIASFKRVSVDQSAEWRRKFDVQELLGDVLRTLAPSYKNKAWTVELLPNDNGIECDSYPGALSQVVSNLVQNAMVHGLEHKESGCIEIKASRVPNNMVCIRVKDDGAGMTPDVMAKIFDPFFTTKKGQGGSGLGLTVCFNLVTGRLGGEIKVNSVVAEGSEFIIMMPLKGPDDLEGDLSAEGPSSVE